jgi:antagonist of KipI
MKLFQVIQPGFFTTVQDLGRHGFLKYGVPISGAMDEFSLRLANMLVGNNPNDACLEITAIGPALEALGDTQIGVTGGNISFLINEQDAEMWQTLRIKKGDLVSFGRVRGGCRSYISVRGGINVPLVLGSRSTYLRLQIGGFQGRQLKVGDVLEGFTIQPLNFRLSVPKDFIPTFKPEAHVKVTLGPQLENFTAKGVENFLSNPYTVSIEADRMGYRLDGAAIELKTHGDIVSDAILPGSVQIPSNGKPIITMQDAQTTGGYAKIAAVVTSGLHILGQAAANDKVYFHKVTLSEAHQTFLEYKMRFEAIENEMFKEV